MANSQDALLEAIYGKDLKKKLMKQIQEADKKAQDEAWEEFLVVAQKDMKQIYKQCVDRFYDSYEPSFYERDYLLYNLLHCDIKPDGNSHKLVMDFDDTIMELRNGGGEEYMYNTIFKQGYHGGAKAYVYNTTSKKGYYGGDHKNSGYFVPVSYPAEAYDGQEESPWENMYYSQLTDNKRKYNWEAAQQADISVFDDFMNHKIEYENTVEDDKYNEILAKKTQKYMSEIII